VPSGVGNVAVPEGAGSGGGDGALYVGIGSDTPSGGGGLDPCILDGDLVMGVALSVGYRNMCGLGKGVLASGDDSIGRGGSGFDARVLSGGLTRAGGCTGDLNRGRPDNDVGGLDALANGGLDGTGGSATLLFAQRGGRLGADAGGLRGPGQWLLGCHSTSDLAHYQRSKMLLSLSESGWGHPLVGGT
jgi:hypothetical protein